MCVAFWSLEHPDYALILCNNRDEFLARPTAPAHWHAFGPISADDNTEGPVLSGRDLLAGGTWAGINRNGRLALLTNITEPERKYASSRGDLTSSFLLPKDPKHTLQAEIDEFLLENRDRAYAGFNLLLLTPAPTRGDSGPRSLSLSFDGARATNSGGGGPITARMLTQEERECGGMSNGVDHHGASEWPKVQHGIQTMKTVLNSLPQDAAEIVERLFALLTWKSEHAPLDRSELRNTILVDPLPIGARESPDGGAAPNYYGTRSSTVILIRRDGAALFIERDIWTLDDDGRVQRGDPGRDRVFRFQIEPDGLGALRTEDTLQRGRVG
ncbi:NRDE protein-domain-containing protein [Trametes polyzona]|nr:NRDE protein-domain-containing protein [Trametes polyzona]